ncbi:MAG: OmpA family protein [Clostridiales Family XIII bacterium]|jgi:chemotaxis protein MotB|nr:OmpA family protein [Clostridiales Family XIII bacterium]
MAKRHEQHEEHADESWLIPYADLLTLLLALFIVLFASSSVNEEKYNSIAEAFYTAFNGYFSDVMSQGIGGDGSGDMGDLKLPYPEAGKENEEAQARAEAEQAAAEAAAMQLGNLFESLSEYVTENNLENTIAVEFQGESVLVVLKNDVWFESGSAELTPTMYAQVGMLADLIQANQTPEEPLEVVVAGHTDNVPSNSARYPSNWYLSLARAVNFLAALLEDGDLSSERFSVRPYGETRPIASNDTPEGRKLNRRVELLISRPKIISPPDNLLIDALRERLGSDAVDAKAAPAKENATPEAE